MRIKRTFFPSIVSLIVLLIVVCSGIRGDDGSVGDLYSDGASDNDDGSGGEGPPRDPLIGVAPTDLLGGRHDRHSAFLDETSGLFTTVTVDSDDPDHRHHHVRRTQLADDCVGYPVRIDPPTIYIILFDAFGKVNEQEEIDELERITRNVLTECRPCVDVTKVTIMSQDLQQLVTEGRDADEDRYRLVFRVLVEGTCPVGNCAVVADSISRWGRQLAGGEYADRRDLMSCEDKLRNRFQNSGVKALECLTLAEITGTDPRCL